MIKLKRLITLILLVLLVFLLISAVNACNNDANNITSVEENNNELTDFNDNSQILTVHNDENSVAETLSYCNEFEINDAKSFEIHDNTLKSSKNEEIVLSKNNENITQTELLSNNNDEVLSDFLPASTQIILTINDTSKLNETGNITINMHFSFTAIEHNGEFTSQNINIYENNTIIKKLNIGEQNLPELGIITGTGTSSSINYQADFLFNYTVKDNTYLTTSLFGVYSNTIQFEKIKDMITIMNTTQIKIDGQYISNETWDNTINSIKKALTIVKNNGTIQLNNINILQDTTETITINKNLTIIGNNASFKLEKTQSLFEITPYNQVTFVNLTFTGNNHYAISNKGKLQLINCTFKDNSLGLINNNGELELNDCNIQDINQFYQTKTTNTEGLITNNGILKITNTLFNNNNPLPYNLPIESTTLKGIIYNKQTLIVENVNFTNINYRIIYNDGEITLKETLFENIHSSATSSIYILYSNEALNQNYIYNTYQINENNKTISGGAIYNANQTTLIKVHFKNIKGDYGGAVYNSNNLIIKDSLFENIQSKTSGRIAIGTSANSIPSTSGCAIYNTGTVNINNTQINNNNGGAIYNLGILNINNTQINKTITSAIYNNGILNINNTLITECSGVGAAIYNVNVANIENCKIINNQGLADTKWRYEVQSNGQIFSYVDKVYSGVIYNDENANANITKSVIKNNILYCTSNGNWRTYYGNVKNEGILKISGCVFDNNIPYWDGRLNTGDGSFNIYNTGKLTIMYCYLLNTKTYTGSSHNPTSFLYNTGGGTCNINYNFYCLSPSSIIRNANPNYYFIPTFEDDYYPIKLNQNTNITLKLILTNGINEIEFNDWDMLLNPGLNTTITTINENGEYYNITVLLKDKITFNFNYTSITNEYPIYANILNYKTNALVDVGKEFANMTVTYNNITYNDGNNITFHINITGNNNTPTGKIILTFNNQKYIVNLTDGECNFTIPEKLKPANYTIRIEYNGSNEYFKILKQHYKFTVHKIPVNVTMNVTEVKYGQTGTITITLSPDTARLYGNLYIDGKLVKENLVITKTITQTINRVVGRYNLTLIVNEDEYYSGGMATTMFIVNKWETNLTLESKDINAGEDAILNITINPGDVRGDIILEINGVNRSGHLSAATTTITLTNLQNGTYHVTVYYPGDRKYAPSSASTTFNVARKSTQLNVTITNNPDLTGNIIVKTNNTNCTGPVGVYINNDPRLTLNLTQGMANFTVKFKRGTNLIYVYYLGDDYYSFATWNTTIPIEGKAIITTNNTLFTEQNTSNYIIQLKDTDNNPYEYTPITVEFKNQNSTLTTNENGIVYYPVTCKAGTYNITITYKNYTKHDTITVKPSNINIDIKDILAGQTEIITITLPNNATGNITFTLDNTPYNRTLTNASTVLEVPNLSLGLHNLTITYSGDENFINQTITQTFHIKNSISWITLQSTNTVYGEAITVKATVIAGATGNVTFQIANQTQTVTLTGNTAEATFKNITAGDKIITAHYNGDSIYQGSDNSIKISVARANTTLEIITSELKVNENILITALVNPDATGNVTFRIQGQYSPRNRTITDGNSSWLISPLNSGSYKLIVTYNGDNNYNSITHEEILIINRIEAKLTIKIGDVSDSDDLMVYATLTDINNQKVSDNITLEINGKYYKIIITNGAGSRNLGEFKAGKYTYSATYNGNNILAMAIADGEFNVVKSNYKISGNTDITQYYGATKYYKIRLTNNNQPVKNEIITITINKNTVKIKTDNNGYATLKLSLKAGKYTITATYKNVKVSNKITVKPTLITKNKKIKKGKTLTYTAKLLNKNGKALKNKKITFKINGKKYKAKTNKKGIAKIKVKKLKVGKYKILTTYGKQKNTNTITVKK